ncbi:MAG: hypothetical protein HOQ24_09370 [Mycobacteriaceae bacterium]|nr:hypothetical protein [Mycobacteriaceae bacterium]
MDETPEPTGETSKAPEFHEPATPPKQDIPPEPGQTAPLSAAPDATQSYSSANPPPNTTDHTIQSREAEEPDIEGGLLRPGLALDYAFQAFAANRGAWLTAAAFGFLVHAFFVLLVWMLRPSSIVAVVLLLLAMAAAVLLYLTALTRGALDELDGRRPRFGQFLNRSNTGTVVATAALIVALSAIGWTLCVVPGIVVGLLSMFALHFVIDHQDGATEAILSSCRLVLANLVPLLILAFTNTVLLLIGVLTCGLGLFLALPVSALSAAYAYRTLTYGRVTHPGEQWS